MAISTQLIDGTSYHYKQPHNKPTIKLAADQLPDQLPVLLQNFSIWILLTSYPTSYPNNIQQNQIQNFSNDYLQHHLLLHHDQQQQTTYYISRTSTVLWTHTYHYSEVPTSIQYHRYMKSGSAHSINCTNPRHSPDQVQHLPHDTVFRSTHNMMTLLCLELCLMSLIICSCHSIRLV